MEVVVEQIQEQFVRVERWLGRRLFAAPVLGGDRRMLFVLGHMRTGSSLLVHILASHRKIKGYGETHNIYADAEDFGATAAKVYRQLRSLPGEESYVLDKVLHAYQIANADVLAHPSVRVIFMIRRPDMALSSMVRNDVVSGPDEACQHYIEQLGWVEELSTVVPAEQWTHTTYTELTQKTEDVLSRLESFLELVAPLSERYETNRHTGTSGIGDPGPHIEAGYIKRDIDRDVDRRIRPYVDRSRAQYKSCLRSLEEADQFASTSSPELTRRNTTK